MSIGRGRRIKYEIYEVWDMSNYCTQKGMPCEFANLNGYCQDTACTKLFSVTYEAYGMRPLTNADKIRSMTNDELADFFFESPKIEFEVCEYCKNFGGHMSDVPCKHDMGLCFIPDKNEAFKKWLQQPYKE